MSGGRTGQAIVRLTGGGAKPRYRTTANTSARDALMSGQTGRGRRGTGSAFFRRLLSARGAGANPTGRRPGLRAVSQYNQTAGRLGV